MAAPARGGKKAEGGDVLHYRQTCDRLTFHSRLVASCEDLIKRRQAVIALFEFRLTGIDPHAYRLNAVLRSSAAALDCAGQPIHPHTDRVPVCENRAGPLVDYPVIVGAFDRQR